MRHVLRLIVVALAGAIVFVYLMRWPPPPTDTYRALPPIAHPLPDPLRVGVIGTSLTARYDWPKNAVASLQACLGQAVTLTVLAKGGAASDWGAKQAETLEATVPDIVLIEFTINDADLRRRVSLAEAEQYHRTMIEALRAGGRTPRILLVTLNRPLGLKAVLRPRVAAYEAQYDALAQDLDLGRLSLGPAWEAALAAGESDRLIPDGVHPSPEAVAHVVTPRVTAELRRLANRGRDGSYCPSESTH